MRRARVEIRVLGPLELVVDGRVRPVPGAADRALLALLALAGGRVSTDRLIDALWGRALPANPVNALQQRASKLRRVVGPALVTQPPGYRLDVDPDRVDAVRFARLVGERRFQEALALWRGPPLAEFAAQDWARVEVTRLEELRATAAEEQVEARLAAGEHAALVAGLEALVAADPFRERLRGQLMLALYRCGRTAEALAGYREFRERLGDELGLAPSVGLRRLEEAILRQDAALDAPVATPRPVTSLPAPLSSLIGRQEELRRIPEFLARSRLLTLVGPGGAGKTRLAVAAARQAAARHRDGVWFVPLAGVTDATRIPAAVAGALGLSDPGSASARRLVSAWLGPRQALLVVDNCEHLADPCARFVEQLLGTAEQLHVLATSREPLGVPGEVQLPVPPLPAADAVSLFVERARGVRPDFALDDDEPGVRRICRRLDGLPLAIELAAARVKTLSVAEVAARLDDRFGLLTSGLRTAEARHRTLRATVDWSYELLTSGERVLLRRLAVFQGGWTMEAAEAVCGRAGGSDVLDLLSGLVDRSLVVAEGGRFRMLETIRAYAAARLAEAGEDEAMGERHAHYYTGLAETAEPALRAREQAVWLRRLRTDDTNFHGALSWARDRAASDPDRALRLAAALGWYWYVERQVEGREQLVATLEAAVGGSAGTRARALQALSLAARPAGCIVHPSAEGARAARDSLALLVEIDEPARAALSRLLLAVEGVAGGDTVRFLSEVEQARATLAAHHDPWGVALADFVEMEIRLHHGPVDQALGLGEAAAGQFDALADAWGRSAVRLHLGYGLRLAGRVEDAVAVLDRAVALSRDAGLPNNLARSLVELGEAALQREAADEAERWFAQAEQLARELGHDSLLALVALGRGTAARWRRDPAAARHHFTEALDLSLAADMPRSMVRARAGIAAAELDEGAAVRAGAQLRQARDMARAIGDAGLDAAVLEQLARAAGDDAERAGLVEQAAELRARHHRPRTPLEDRDVQAAAEPAGPLS
jgi:predicted ATPase/DNA-binding SARP family transcriptional activator